jgi:hypothetical protein
MGIEHVYVVYDPSRPINRFDLGFKKITSSIELTYYDTVNSNFLLGIDEIEGNTTVIVHKVVAPPLPPINETLREKTFCVLGQLKNINTPVHSDTFTPRHLSALTLTLRQYDSVTGTFTPAGANDPKVGLWFKIQTLD